MKIFGIGTDIVNIKRMDISFKKHGFIFKKKYSPKKKFLTVKAKKAQVVFMQRDLLLKKLLVKLWAQVLEKVLILKI